MASGFYTKKSWYRIYDYYHKNMYAFSLSWIDLAKKKKELI